MILSEKNPDICTNSRNMWWMVKHQGALPTTWLLTLKKLLLGHNILTHDPVYFRYFPSLCDAWKWLHVVISVAI